MKHLSVVTAIMPEPPRDKTKKMTVHPAKTQISLGIHPVWSESLLCAQWIAKDSSFLHADSEDSDQTGRFLHADSEDPYQTGRMPRLIWVFAGRTIILLVLSWGGYNICLLYSLRSLTSSFVPLGYPLSHIMRQPVFGICDQVRLKPACSADETS